MLLIRSQYICNYVDIVRRVLLQLFMMPKSGFIGESKIIFLIKKPSRNETRWD
jgi:hypothetical protein